MEPGFTRGGSQGVQLEPGAIKPRAAELFEVDNQLRILTTNRVKVRRTALSKAQRTLKWLAQ